MTTVAKPLSSDLPSAGLVRRTVIGPPGMLLAAVRRIGSGLAAAGRAGQLGSDRETTIGRHTGARI